MAIERPVEQAYDSAKGRSVAHLDGDALSELGIEAGDTIALEGDSRTVVTAAEQREGDVATEVVRVDEFTRDNAGVGPGETVSIEPVTVSDAERAVLRPVAPQCVPIAADHAPMVQNDLLETPTCAGERVWVMVGPHRPFGVVVGSWRPLTVVETDPDGPVVLTRETNLHLQSAIDDVNEGTAGDTESWDHLRETVFDRDGRACRNCGVDFDTGSATLEAHFVVAPAHGGTVDADNMVTLCRKCHATAHEYVTTPSV